LPENNGFPVKISAKMHNCQITVIKKLICNILKENKEESYINFLYQKEKVHHVAGNTIPKQATLLGLPSVAKSYLLIVD
jgi:hypothetical protein